MEDKRTGLITDQDIREGYDAFFYKVNKNFNDRLNIDLNDNDIEVFFKIDGDGDFWFNFNYNSGKEGKSIIILCSFVEVSDTVVPENNTKGISEELSWNLNKEEFDNFLEYYVLNQL